MQEVRSALSSVKIAEYEEDDSLIDIELSVLRKLAAAVAITRGGEEIQQICRQTTNVQELQEIRKYLGLQKVQTLKQLLMEGPEERSILDDGYGENFYELRSIIGKFSSPKYLQDSLLEYVMSITTSKNETLEVDMPINQILMTPYFEFDFCDIPQNFQSL